jgi:CheY-like chemotaxis protein/DNA-binding MarR family transcriptional regulator
MREDEAYDNRKQIFRYVLDNPGSHLRKIAKQLEMNLSTLRYHIDRLEKDGLIVSQRQNNLKFYYASGKLKPHEKNLTRLLQQEHFRNIILLLIDSPGSTFSQIADSLSMSPSSVSKYVNTLEDEKILSHEKLGRQKRYYISDKRGIVELLKTYRSFMADMSYEIRTPMSTIMGITSLLLDENITPEQRDFLETIKTSADALMASLNNILDFSRAEQEKEKLDIRTFYLRNCIEEAMEIVAAKAATKRLNLAYKVDTITPIVIVGDSSKLRHILVSLLDYAIRSTEGEEVVLLVSSKRLDPFYEIHFELRNAGMGMPLEVLDHPSGPTGRAYDAQPVSSPEEDFSLSTSRELIELMGGRIWEEVGAEKGSAIHFTIKTQHLRSILPLAGVQPLLEGKRILIVESANESRDILAAQAGEWGMRPAAAVSDKKALKLIRDGEAFDIALVNANPAQENGSKIARELHGADAQLPLVALAFAGQEIEPGLFVRTITKPVRQSDLYNALISGMTDRKPAEKEARIGPLRILLAEDNISNQKVILAILKRLGYEADAVANGKEALSALEAGHYDVVFMDVKMPEMDGLEATRIIRQRWPDKGPKIIAITAYALKGDRERCLEAGMDDYISKPVRMEDLAQALGRIGLKKTVTRSD